MVDVSKTEVKYWTSSITNTTDEDQLLSVEESFLYPFLDSASNYVLCVERFEVSLNSVPFYDNSRNEVITLTTVPGGIITFLSLSRDCYSLMDLINVVNEAMSDGDDFELTDEISINEAGLLTLCWVKSSQYSILWPIYLGAILGLPNGVLDSMTNSTGSRFDIGDEIQGAELVSTLGVFSDTVGQSKINILTDVSFGQQFLVTVNATDSSVTQGEGIITTFEERGRLIYEPTNRRYLMISDPRPLQLIQIRPYYRSIDGTNKIIPIPPGGVFSIKLGFYRINPT